MALETAWDIAQEKLDAMTMLEPHPLEHLCIPEDLQLPPLEKVESETLTLLEVYMDVSLALHRPLPRKN